MLNVNIQSDKSAPIWGVCCVIRPGADNSYGNPTIFVEAGQLIISLAWSTAALVVPSGFTELQNNNGTAIAYMIAPTTGSYTPNWGVPDTQTGNYAFPAGAEIADSASLSADGSSLLFSLSAQAGDWVTFIILQAAQPVSWTFSDNAGNEYGSIDGEVGADSYATPTAVLTKSAPEVTTVDPELVLRWSDDGGRTWSNEHARSIGKAGKYKTRSRWLRMGTARDRVYEVSTTEPARIVDAYITAIPGTGV